MWHTKFLFSVLFISSSSLSVNAFTISRCNLIKSDVFNSIEQNKMPSTSNLKSLLIAIEDAKRYPNHSCHLISVATYYGVAKTLGMKKLPNSITDTLSLFSQTEMKILATDARFQEIKTYIGLDNFKKNEFTFDTPLHRALFSLNFKLAKKLIKEGADLNAKGNSGWRPLYVAAGAGNIEILKIILSKGIDPDQISPLGRTPLTQSVINNRINAIEYLLSVGANPNIKDKNGGSPLLFAAMRGHTHVAESLISGGANINIRDIGGMTPLMMAARKGYLDVVSLLIEKSANLNIVDANGNDALKYAQWSGQTKIESLLIKAEVFKLKVSVKNENH